MIAGHGIDIVEVQRVRSILAKYGEKFKRRYFHHTEIRRSERLRDPAQFFASRFAAKEAFSKAVGTGFSGFGPRDVIVAGGEYEPPRIIFSERLKRLFPGAGEEQFILSISHEKEIACASVIWSKPD